MRFLERVQDEIKHIYKGTPKTKVKSCLILPSQVVCDNLRNNFKNDFKNITFITLDNFILKNSKLSLESEEYLVSILYESYSKFLNYKISYIKFYDFGRDLLNDFSDLNSNLINTDRFFKILEYHKTIDVSFDFLSIEQKKVLNEFWSNFKVLDKYKSTFLKLWQNLPQIYSDFHKKLFFSKVGYKGLIQKYFYRDLVKHKYKFNHTNYIVGGFSTLTKVELKTIEWLYSYKNTKVLWDLRFQQVMKNQDFKNFPIFKNIYDSSILRKTLNQDYKKTNTILFGKINIKTLKETKNKFNISPTIKIFKSNSHYSVLCQIINQLKEFSKKDLDNILIVNFDEEYNYDIYNRLKKEHIPFKTSVGISIDNFPLYQLLKYIFNLNQQNIDFEEKSYLIKSLFQHPYLILVIEIFDPFILSNTLLDPKIDIFKKLYLIVYVLKVSFARYKYDIIIENELKIVSTLIQNLKNLKIEKSFYKNPSKKNKDYKKIKNFILENLKKNKILLPSSKKGISISNIVDTSCFDYEKIFFLNVNESMVTGSNKLSSSNIPYNIRKMFNLPTFDNYNNYFYQYLIKRLMVNSKTINVYYLDIEDEKSEISRYFLKDSLDKNEDLSKTFIQKHLVPLESLQNQSTEEILNYILTEKGISPSAINTYLDCEFKFYLKYILKICSKIEESESLILGNLVHKTLEKCYESQNYITRDFIDTQIKNLQNTIDELLSNFDQSITNSIIKTITYNTVKKILLHDRKNTPFQLIGVEVGRKESNFRSLDIDKLKNIKIKGIIDRLDLVDGKLRVIDYKTGFYDNKIVDLDSLFEKGAIKRNKIALQLFIYSWIAEKYYPNMSIYPKVIGLKNIFEGKDRGIFFDKKDKKNIKDVSYLVDDLKLNLKSTFEEMVESRNVFKQTKDVNICKFCEYNTLCNR